MVAQIYINVKEIILITLFAELIASKKVLDFYLNMCKIEGMREPLLKFLHKQVKDKTVSALAKEIGMEIPTLWRIMYGKSAGSIEAWEKIDKYYKRCVKALGG